MVTFEVGVQIGNLINCEGVRCGRFHRWRSHRGSRGSNYVDLSIHDELLAETEKLKS